MTATPSSTQALTAFHSWSRTLAETVPTYIWGVTSSSHRLRAPRRWSGTADMVRVIMEAMRRLSLLSFRASRIVGPSGEYTGDGVPQIDQLFFRVRLVDVGLGLEEALHVGHDARHEFEQPQAVAEAAACFRFGLGAGVQGEGEWDGEFCLVQVGYVVDEGLLVAAVYEAEGG